MENIKDVVQDAIDNFDFEKVQKAMTDMDWRWGGNISVDDNDNFVREGGEVPTIDQLKNTATRLLEELSKKDKYPSNIQSGGFVAMRLTANAMWLGFCVDSNIGTNLRPSSCVVTNEDGSIYADISKQIIND